MKRAVKSVQLLQEPINLSLQGGIIHESLHFYFVISVNLFTGQLYPKILAI